MDTAQQAAIIKNQFINHLYLLPATARGKWGVMNAQQMVEHLIEYVQVANGRKILPIVTPADKWEKAQAFLHSAIPFKENTSNVLMAEIPAPLKFESQEQAVNALKEELDYFFEFFERHPMNTTCNPFFGALNLDLNIRLLYKHFLHHITQFG